MNTKTKKNHDMGHVAVKQMTIVGASKEEVLGKLIEERRLRVVYLEPQLITTLFNLAIEGGSPHQCISLPLIYTGEPNCIVVHNCFDHSRDCYAIVIGNMNFDPVPVGTTIPSIDYNLKTVKIPIDRII